jgi:uncharacterized protein
MDKVVHFEIPADDLPRASEFYRSVFGWQLQHMPDMNDYTLAMTTPVDASQRPTEPGGINGGLMRRSGETPNPVITIGVDAIDDTLKQVESAGGETLVARTPIENMGAFAYFRDPEGNVLGLWEVMGGP